jgi:hypothetical protein
MVGLTAYVMDYSKLQVVSTKFLILSHITSAVETVLLSGTGSSTKILRNFLPWEDLHKIGKVVLKWILLNQDRRIFVGFIWLWMLAISL